MNKDITLARNRWLYILFDYRKDYKKKYLLEKKAEKTEEQINNIKDGRSKRKLRKDYEKVLTELKEYDKLLLEKYRLKRLLDPFNFIDDDFQVSPFLPSVEVVSKDDDYIKVKIDRSYAYDAIQKELIEIMKALDEAEGKKHKKSGRPKLIRDPQIIRDCAKSWHELFTLLQKYPGGNKDFQIKIRNTMVSELVLEHLKEVFPYIQESTLKEYSKPYRSMKK